MLRRLAEGRKIAAARRAAGLPTKRRERELEGRGVLPGSPAKVKKGSYSTAGSPRQPKPAPAKAPAAASAKRSPKKAPAAPRAPRTPRVEETKPELNRAQRAYAKLMGYQVD